jgi:hypothetical protein
MENLHLLATDKPSRLVLEIKNNNLFITTTYFKNDLMKHQNIYITCDEEIKEGDWYLDTFNTQRIKANQFSDHKHYGNACKKIILTTDQDLIKDGVQAIDEEFLEWFIKNPSCEGVKVKYDYFLWRYSDKRLSDCHKIIIPQEELIYTESAKKEEIIFNSTMMFKQETLEEVAERLYPRLINDPYNPMEDDNKEDRDTWLKGAKFQQERMYSEEDMIEFGKYLLQLSNSAMSRKFNMKMLDSETGIKLTKDLFEQFKKK